MKITNGVTEVRYCGDLTRRDLLVSGNYVVLTFHTDWLLENKRGFEIFFSEEVPGKFKKVTIWHTSISVLSIAECFMTGRHGRFFTRINVGGILGEKVKCK